MPIKLGSVTVNPPGIESVYLGSYLVYLAGKLTTVTGVSPLSLVNSLAKPIKSLIQYGKCVQNNTPTPSVPVDILCNNGAIKYGVLGKNLFDPSTVTDENKYISATSGLPYSPSSGSFRYSDYISIIGNEMYYFGLTPYTANVAGIAWYSEDKTIMRGRNATWLKNNGMKDSAPATAKFVRFSINIDAEHDANWQNTVFFCKDGDLTEYEPYKGMGIIADGTPEVLKVSASGASDQNATVQNLYSVYDNKDEQDLVNGIITHNIGVKVLNGTDSIAVVDGTFRINLTGKEVNTKVLCTHFNGDIDIATSRVNMPDLSVLAHRTNSFVYIRYNEMETAEDFNAYLAAQYNAGTPVIILYPLATPVVEQITPQVLSTNEGSNTVTVTSNVDPVELKVESWSSK